MNPINQLKKIVIILISTLFFQGNGHAEVLNAFVSIDSGSIIFIDLAESITEPDQASIRVSQTQVAGSTAILSGSTVRYTPPSATFIGRDSFSYEVLNSVNAVLGFGIVTVSIGRVAKPVTSFGTPAEAISGALNSVCITNVGTQLAVELVDLCNAYILANGAELAQLSEVLAPKEIAAQNQMSVGIAKQQVDNIRARLSNLRLGNRGSSTSQFSFKSDNNKIVRLDELFLTDSRGGGASAIIARSSKLSVFSSGTVGSGRHDQSSNEDGYALRSSGLSFGVDYRIDSQTVLGAALGTNSSGIIINQDPNGLQNGGDLDVQGFNLIGYGSYYVNSKTYLESIVSLYQNTFTATRNVEFSSNGTEISSSSSSETNNGMFSLSLGAGHEVYYRKGLTLNASGNLDYIKTSFDGYAESGGGGVDLSIDSRREEQLTANISLHGSYAISTASGVFVPQFDVAWKHEFIQDAVTVKGTFSNDPNGTRFTFNSDKIDPDYFMLNIGLSYIIPGGTTGYMTFDKSLGRSRYSEYRFSTGVRAEF